MKHKNNLFLLISALSISILSGCHNNDPKKEDVPEMITKVTLTFTGGGEQIVVSATDPDGDGIQNIQTDGKIILKKATTYKLAIGLINGLAQPNDAAYNVTTEVEQEGDEHMFFFAFTNDTFSDPAGNGNVDTRGDAVNYSGGDNSRDANGLPLGLTTTWTTVNAVMPASTLRVLLKHQPGLKSQTSSSSDGETDLDITFDLEVR